MAKIVLIGAGSMAFTPTLVATFIADPFYRGSEIALVDIHEERLTIMHNLLLRLNKEKDLDISFTAHLDRETALPDADIVILCFAVGSHEAFLKDNEIPTKYGFVQSDGETLGPGGISRGLRHIPLAVAIAKDCERLCPNAHLYNYTNPMAPMTQAVYKYTSMKCTGLCIGAELTKGFAMEVLREKDNGDVQFLAAGMNHGHFLLELRRGNEDLYPKLRQKCRDMFKGRTFNEVTAEMDEISKNMPENSAHFNELSLCVAMCAKMGYFPGPGDGHIGEFYPQWFTSTPDQRKRHDMDQVYIRKLLATYKPFAEKITKMSNYEMPLDYDLFQVGKTWEESQLNDIEIAMRENKGEIFHINIPNHGYIVDIPDGIVVEIPVVVDAGGYHPIGVGHLPKEIAPCIVRHALSQDLLIEAAMEGDFDKVMAVFGNDPNCFDLEIGEQCMRELIEANIEHLPQFQK